MLRAIGDPGSKRRFGMADIIGILQSSYAASPQSLISPGSKFANVDATKWEGTWTGQDYKHQPVTVSITKVAGYRASVTMQSSDGLQFQRAFITTKNTFRIGDSSFALTADGKALVTTIVTDPTTGNQTKNTTPVTRKD
jgi:hypothetical protein